ncbi:MAG: lipopolysaccharide heptosyltransferase II [bacterium]|jgi:heptosyltransferase-2|nr:lipopolysaccharide heptosyltransferase II [candidate division KSB1 bacterium]MDH7561009.1 lipopolysaccharide heptosyltransferase II [bacterium]
MSRRTTQAPPPGRILVIRLSSIGDIVLASPLLRALHNAFPEAAVDFVVKEKFADLVRFSPYVHRVHVLPEGGGLRELRALRRSLKAHGYELVVDLHKNFRSYYLRTGLRGARTVTYRKWRWARAVLIAAKKNLYPGIVPVHQRYLAAVAPLGVCDDGEGPEFFIDPAAGARVRKLLSRAGFLSRPMRVAVVPGAGFFTKRWLPERFAEVADALAARHGRGTLLLGDANDRPIAAEVLAHMQHKPVDMVGALSLMESAAALSCCDLVLCNDTGLMHIATALRKKVVAIFGPTTEELGFFPFGPRSRVVQKELPCRPCSHIGSRRCPKRHFRCMRDISAAEVLAAAEGLLAQES